MTRLRSWLILLALAAALAGVIGARSHHHPPPCTHGLSSIGPVVIVNGRVSGNTNPTTESCLP